MFAHWIDVADSPSHTIHIAQLLHRRPVFVAFTPTRAWGNPYRKGLGEVLVRMLLCIPAFHMPDKVARKRHGTILVAVGTPKGAKLLLPLRCFVQRVCVIDSVSGLVAQIHHDLPRVLQIVHLFFETGQLGIGEVKRYANNRFPRWTSPFVSEIAQGSELLQPFGLQLTIELIDESLQRRSFQLEPKFTDGLT